MLSVQDLFWREDEPWLVLQLLSGRRTAVPASWTDLSSDPSKSARGQAEAYPLVLLELARHCHTLRQLRAHPASEKRRRKE